MRASIQLPIFDLFKLGECIPLLLIGEIAKLGKHCLSFQHLIAVQELECDEKQICYECLEFYKSLMG